MPGADLHGFEFAIPRLLYEDVIDLSSAQILLPRQRVVSIARDEGSGGRERVGQSRNIGHSVLEVASQKGVKEQILAQGLPAWHQRNLGRSIELIQRLPTVDVFPGNEVDVG